MSAVAALLDLTDDLNTHLGEQHDVGQLRHQHAKKLVQQQHQRQHTQTQKQQQRKRHREEQQQQRELQFNRSATQPQPAVSASRTQRRGAWSGSEISELHVLLRSTRRRRQGYGTDSDDDDSDGERRPADGGGAELAFDDYCAIARRLRRPVQEVMTASAPASSPLAAFLRSSAVEAAEPDGVALYTAHTAQQFDLSLELQTSRQEQPDEHTSGRLGWEERSEQRRPAQAMRRAGSEDDEEADSADDEVSSSEDESASGSGSERESEEKALNGESGRVARSVRRMFEHHSDSANEEEAATAVERRARPAHRMFEHDSDHSDSSDSSYEGDGGQSDGEEAEELSDDELDSGRSETDESSDDVGSGNESDSVASVESDIPLSARAKHRVGRHR